MGTGTSHGIPAIGCTCAVCRSADPRDNRNRCSAYIEDEYNGVTTRVVIDTGPEFRIQALRFHVTALDAVLITHAHADHLDGLDDLRVFSYTKSADNAAETPGGGLPLYANSETLPAIRARYGYIFEDTPLGGGKPKLRLIDASAYTDTRPLTVGSLSIVPVPLLHGTLPVSGWLIRSQCDGLATSIAYLTDCSMVPDSSIKLLTRSGGVIEHAVIDGLRETKHETHFSYLDAMRLGAHIGARHVWLTHLCHNMSHVAVSDYCTAHLNDFPRLRGIVAAGGSVGPGYDGVVLTAGPKRAP